MSSRRFYALLPVLLASPSCQHDGAKQDGDTANLTIEVAPPEGISILIDDKKLATQAPLRTQLAAGNHVLEVRGMGYLPLSLPLSVHAGDDLTVPVSLRRRPPPMPPKPEPPPVPPKVAHKSERRPQPIAEPLVELPEGVAPLLLHLIAEPQANISVDGVRTSGRDIAMRHVRGNVQVGTLRLGYDITPSRVLEFEIPDDGATWYKDGTLVKATSVVRLLHGATRLRRQTDVTDQSLIVQRIL